MRRVRTAFRIRTRPFVYPILTRYVLRHFIIALLATVAAVCGLILLFDIIELLRETARIEAVTIPQVVTMAVMRLPKVVQTALPFIFLAAATITFWQMARSSELVVIRASGVSIWSILLPIMAVVLALGVLNLTVGTPMSAFMFKQFEQTARSFGMQMESPLTVSRGELWLREPRENGYTLVHGVNAHQEHGVLRMRDLLVMDVGPDAIPDRRLDAQTGRLHGDRLWLYYVWVRSPGKPAERLDFLSVPTTLSLPRIQENFAQPVSLSFWELPEFIEFFESAGFKVQAHRMHWHSLLASPAMLCAMTLLAAVFAANVSPRRAGWLWRVAGCTVAGFLVYFFSQVTYTLGQTEALPLALAAWSPPIVTGLLGAAVLFHVEDG